MRNLSFSEVLCLGISIFLIGGVAFDIYKVNKNNKDDSKEKMTHSYLDIIISLLISVVAICFVFFIGPVHVSGSSMEPNFHDKQWLIQNKSTKNYSVGDVIVFYYPEEEKYLIKRIIAEGGDTVEVKNLQLFFNGEKIDETYNTIPFDFDFTPIIVPEGEYFVLGDNRPVSLDSRYDILGTIKPELITGKIILNK